MSQYHVRARKRKHTRTLSLTHAQFLVSIFYHSLCLSLLLSLALSCSLSLFLSLSFSLSLSLLLSFALSRTHSHNHVSSLAEQVARTLLFADQTWETIQSVQQPGGRQTQDRGTMQVVEYVLGRPWQTDYSSLDPSVSFLISQGNRGRAGGSRVSSAEQTRASASRGEGGEKRARARDVTMTFQPLLRRRLRSMSHSRPRPRQWRR